MFALQRSAMCIAEHVRPNGVDSFSIPGSQSTMRMLNRTDEASTAIDTVMVIQETSKIAEGRLSLKTQETLNLLTNQITKPRGG